MSQNNKKIPRASIWQLLPNNKEKVKFSLFFHYVLIILLMWLGLFFIFSTVPDNRYFIQTNLISIFGLGIYLGTVIMLIGIFLVKYEPTVIRTPQQLYLLCFLIFNGILITRFTFPVNNFFTFIPAVVMLITIFINIQVAAVTGIALVLSCELLFYNNFLVTSMTLVSSIVAIFTVSKIRSRFELARAGILLSLANIGVIIIFSTLMLNSENIILLNASKTPWVGLVNELIWGAISGIGSSIMAMGLLPYLEDLFGLTTVFKLLELSNPEQPLLRQLLLKAVGTYHHSILVGNLAEAGAESINADRLLARVGAYYHDIGKIKRAHFFIENQMGTNGQYHRFSSRLSSQVIIGHVTEGLTLAQEYKLPPQIQDIIRQHHGTSLISYFYHQAKYEEESEEIEEKDFRYPGPKPRSKESAIVMLADATEAAVRSLNKPTLELLEQTVQKIIQGRLEDGQLSECPITLQELEKLNLTFTKILQGLYHPRIEYPDEELEESDHEIGKKNISQQKIEIDLSE